MEILGNGLNRGRIMFYRKKLSTVLIVLTLAFVVNSCAELKIDPPGPERQALLVLPVLVTNQAQRVGQHGFYYIYEIVNEDDPAITYEAVIKTPVKGDMLIIDTLPPGNYRVDKFIFKTVGSGNFTYGQNVAPRNDKFKLEWGRITVFSKSLNVRIFNKIPGRGGENSYSFNLYPVTREQEDAILVTIKTLPNFEAWHHTLDDEAAVKWYKQAAEQGHASAQFNLGEMYFKGQGVTQDYTRAYMWWEIAASQGDEKAVKKSEKNQELLIPSQLEKVQLLARECVASNYKNC